MQEANEQAKLNEQLWDSRAATYDKRFSFTRWTQKKLVLMLNLQENAQLLDLGCGTGWAVRYGAIQAHENGLFYGVDNSSKMIEQAEALSKNYKNVHFLKSRVEELPLDNSFFDVVISSNAFHHFADPEKALREAYRVLKPSGKLYILDTTANNILMRMVDRVGRKIEAGHVKMYSTNEFRALFGKAGLCYIATEPVFSAIKVHVGQKQM